MKTRIAQRVAHFGVERLPYLRELPRHQHLSAYATVVLDGSFTQLSYAGRLRLYPGDVLINPPLDCHSNHMDSGGVTLARLPWRQEATRGGVYRNVPIDCVYRLAAADVVEASGLLAEQIVNVPYAPAATADWPDKLVIDLHANPRLEIASWAESVGLTRAYAWRCFRRSYGVGPARFRCELNARDALLRIAFSKDPLSQVALDYGFSDQAHMTRAVKALTGTPPSGWRREHLSKTTA